MKYLTVALFATIWFFQTVQAQTDTTITEAIVIVKDGSNTVVNQYYENARIESPHTVQSYKSMETIPIDDVEDLPSSGWIQKGKVYDYNGTKVIARQGHNRTIYEPSATPALFSIHRANSDELEWTANEMVEVGWKRVYSDTTYVCLQSHTTQSDWTPPNTPALWQKEAGEPEPSGCADFVQPTGAHDVYMMGECVTYQGNCYESVIDNNSWSPTTYPAGWSQIDCP